MTYLDKALELYNIGFNSKSSQKKALDLVNRAFDVEGTLIQDKLLSNRPSNFDELYWGIPMYPHQWSEKHNNLFTSDFLENVLRIKEVIELRNAIKTSPICTPIKNELEVKKEAILKEIKSELEKTKETYLSGLHLTKYFGKLHVTVNAHLVRNEYGTVFVRHFFYMFGKLTALNVILAVAEAAKEDK